MKKSIAALSVLVVLIGFGLWWRAHFTPPEDAEQLKLTNRSSESLGAQFWLEAVSGPRVA